MDELSIVNDIIETIGKGAGAASKLTGSVASLKSLFSSPEKVSDVEIKTMLAEMADEVAETKMMNVTLKDQVVTLRDELKERNRFEEQLARYELRTFPGGALVYATKNTDENGDPPHMICPNCTSDRKISLLQRINGYASADCHRCKAEFCIDKPSFIS